MEQAINDSLDYMGKRVVLALAMGGAAGGCLAIYRGHSIPTIASSMARSWALTATACVATQQLAYGILSRTPLFASSTNSSSSNNALILASHGVGGIAGGSVVGFLYISKPVRGMVFLTPLMMAVGMAELKYQERQRQKLDPNFVEETQQPSLNVDGSRALPPPPDLHEHERGRPW